VALQEVVCLLTPLITKVIILMMRGMNMKIMKIQMVLLRRVTMLVVGESLQIKPENSLLLSTFNYYVFRLQVGVNGSNASSNRLGVKDRRLGKLNDRNKSNWVNMKGLDEQNLGKLLLEQINETSQN
jgi:hypothetical protein